MRMRKRVLLQLTPLLDLMMTILFVQYVLLHDVSNDAIAARIQTEDTLSHSRDIEARLRGQNEGLAKERNELQEELDKVKNRLEEVQQSQQVAEKQVQDATKNLERIGGLAKEMFDISPEALQALTGGLNPAQTDRVRQELERIKKESPGKALEELMKLDELRKRCDFWKVHITYGGFVLLSINEKEVGRFQAMDSPEAIVNQFVQTISEIEEPKSIVLVILTHGNALEDVFGRVQSGLRKFLQEQSDKPHSRSRYELSEWGYVPDEKQALNLK